MKGGYLVGGIAIGAVVGVGIGYLLGVDSEKKSQWLRMLSDKVFGGCCCNDEECIQDESLIPENVDKK